MSSVSIAQPAKPQDWSNQKLATLVSRMAEKAWSANRSALVLGCHLMLVVVSFLAAVCVVSETQNVGWSFNVIRVTLIFLIMFRMAALLSARLWRRSLRYAGIPDLISIGKIAFVSSALFWAFSCWQFPQLRLPAALLILDWMFLQVLWGGFHFGARIFKTQAASGRKNKKKRVLLVGAGDAGTTLLKELMTDPASECEPVAVVDDNGGKCDRFIYGVPVSAGTKNIASTAAAVRAQEILVCVPNATAVEMYEIVTGCRKSKLPVRTVPSLTQLAADRVLRWQASPTITQLMDRPEIPIDLVETRKTVEGKVVLVTGAGGSIGSELCRQIADASPQRIILLDKSENSLFYVHRDVVAGLEPWRVRPVLLDILERERLLELFRDVQPEIVFHAAAHKHVGLLELYPQEAIRNNVLGTRNVAEAALKCGCVRFVNISTDKAVSPQSYMGLSKLLAEQYIQELAQTHCKTFCNVRFGNVAGSSGSVLRLFWEQIQKGEPISVTDPRATRFFMSIPEAVHLILRAAALGTCGETFILDMGKPLNIYELARDMMLLAGLEPGRDLPIQFTGLKAGEKIEEELWADWERPVRSGSQRILKIAERNPRTCGILDRIRKIETLLLQNDCPRLLEYLGEIEPGFKQVPRETSCPVVHPPPMGADMQVSAGAA